MIAVVDYGVGNLFSLCCSLERIGADVKVTSDTPKLTCCVCGKEIDEKTYKGSVSKYGKPYCSADCLKTDQEGKDLL